MKKLSISAMFCLFSFWLYAGSSQSEPTNTFLRSRTLLWVSAEEVWVETHRLQLEMTFTMDFCPFWGGKAPQAFFLICA